MYCYALMNQANPNIERTLSNSSTDSKKGTTIRLVDRLDTFFPFDPLALPRSFEFISPLYVEWNSEDDDQDLESEILSEMGSFRTLSLDEKPVPMSYT